LRNFNQYGYNSGYSPIGKHTASRRFACVFLFVIIGVLLGTYFFAQNSAAPIIVSPVIDASTSVDGIADPFAAVKISLNQGPPIETRAEQRCRCRMPENIS
jgi:hypothetical protein